MQKEGGIAILLEAIENGGKEEFDPTFGRLAKDRLYQECNEIEWSATLMQFKTRTQSLLGLMRRYQENLAGPEPSIALSEMCDRIDHLSKHALLDNPYKH